MPSPPFRCKKFLVNQDGAAHPAGTDSILLGSWADVRQVSHALDIGTGTGIIALMLAQRLHERTADFQVDAVEMHDLSANCARQNFRQSPWSAHLHLTALPVQEFTGRQYDLIVSNPPFFTETITAPDEARKNARSTGALHLSDLVLSVKRLLLPTGKCCLIMPVQEGKRLYELATINGLYPTKLTEVITKPGKTPERLLIQLEPTPYPFERSVILMKDEYQQPTMQYKALTGDFYLAY